MARSRRTVLRGTPGTVFQALRYLGREAVDDQVIARLKTVLPAEQKRQLAQDARYTTDWIAAVVRQITARAAKKAEAGHG